MCIPLSIVLDALSSVGRHTEVREVWKKVGAAGFGFDSGNYNHYAVALIRTGDVESGFHVIDRIVLPRWDEVRQRRATALRASNHIPPVVSNPYNIDSASDKDPIDIEDTPVESTDRSNRRDQFRYESPFDQRSREEPEGVVKKLLESWRPQDTLWRPSLLTIAVLDQAYDALDKARKGAQGAWLMLGVEGEEGEEEGGERVVAPIRLENFGGGPVRDPNGTPTKSSASALIARLNRKYARTVALIMLHRRRRRSREFKDRFGKRPPIPTS